MLRFACEWMHPSVLLVRLGGPFVGGLFDVGPSLQLRDGVDDFYRKHVPSPDGKSVRVLSSLSNLKRINVMRLSPLAGLAAMCISAATHCTSRLIALSFCAGLAKIKLGNAAAAAESSERLSTYCLASALRLVFTPILGAQSVSDVVRAAVLSPTVDANDEAYFAAQASSSAGPMTVLKNTFVRNLVVQSAAIINEMLWTRFWTVHYVHAVQPRTHGNVYVRAGFAERFGFKPKFYQLQLKACTVVAQVVGATLGAAAVAAASSKFRASSGATDSSVLLLLAGEMGGAVVARAAAHLYFGRYLLNPTDLLDDEYHALRSLGLIQQNPSEAENAAHILEMIKQQEMMLEQQQQSGDNNSNSNNVTAGAAEGGDNDRMRPTIDEMDAAVAEMEDKELEEAFAVSLAKDASNPSAATAAQ